MAKAALVMDYSKSTEVALCYTKPWWGSGRVVDLDSAFASVLSAKSVFDHGLHSVVNVKTAHREFPLACLKKEVTEREVTKSFTATVKTKGGSELELLACGDKDRQPMCLLSTSSTSNPGEKRNRTVTTIKSDGSFVKKKIGVKAVRSTFALPIAILCG